MSEIRVAARYAKSLLDLAVERKELDAVHTDMLLFSAYCDQCVDLVKMFRNPVVKGDRKLAVVNSIFTGKISPLSLLFLQTVIKKSREMYIMHIAAEFHNAYNAHMNIANATVTTAVAIDEKLKQEIRQTIEQQSGKKVDLRTEIKPDIIGGVVVRMEDRLFDGSIVRKLADIKKNLTNVQ